MAAILGTQLSRPALAIDRDGRPVAADAATAEGLRRLVAGAQ